MILLFVLAGLLLSFIHPCAALASVEIICLRSETTKRYVAAEPDLKTLRANRTQCAPWEKFRFIDENGGVLQNGDVVYIATHWNRYWSAQTDGQLHADRQWTQGWERFTVVRHGGEGPTIEDGDTIALQGRERFVRALMNAQDHGRLDMHQNADLAEPPEEARFRYEIQVASAERDPIVTYSVPPQLGDGLAAKPLSLVQSPIGLRYRLRIEALYLHEQRDRREDLYLNLTTVDGSGEIRSFVTPIWEDLDENQWYFRNHPVYLPADPHGFLEIWASMYDAKTGTYEKVRGIIQAAGAITTAVATAINPIAGGIAAAGAEAANAIVGGVGAGEDDFYGTEYLTWPDGRALVEYDPCQIMRFYEPDDGFSDPGHDIRVVFVLEPADTQSPMSCVWKTPPPCPVGTSMCEPGVCISPDQMCP